MSPNTQGRGTRVSDVARALYVSRDTVKGWLANYPEVSIALANGQKRFKARVAKADKDAKAVRSFMSSIATDRTYSHRHFRARLEEVIDEANFFQSLAHGKQKDWFRPFIEGLHDLINVLQ